MKSQFDEFFVYAVIRHMAREINTKGAFHLSELTGQTFPVAVIISLFLLKSKLSGQISQILNSMHEGDGPSAKTLGKSLFHFQTDW